MGNNKGLRRPDMLRLRPGLAVRSAAWELVATLLRCLATGWAGA